MSSVVDKTRQYRNFDGSPVEFTIGAQGIPVAHPKEHPGPQGPRCYKVKRLGMKDKCVRMVKKKDHRRVDQKTASDIRNHCAFQHQFMASRGLRNLTIKKVSPRVTRALCKRERDNNDFWKKNTKVVGHVPDAAMTGDARGGDFWMPETRSANSSVGGMLGHLKDGTEIERMVVEEQPDEYYVYF